jgi:hypothetical protein
VTGRADTSSVRFGCWSPLPEQFLDGETDVASDLSQERRRDVSGMERNSRRSTI